jgi:cell division ATPase FtsA
MFVHRILTFVDYVTKVLICEQVADLASDVKKLYVSKGIIFHAEYDPKTKKHSISLKERKEKTFKQCSEIKNENIHERLTDIFKFYRQRAEQSNLGSEVTGSLVVTMETAIFTAGFAGEVENFTIPL